MYESFYGLSSKPFQLNPDPHFYFGSTQHRRAKAYLDYGVSRNDGFIVITGEIGAGKTTVLRGLLERLAHTNIVTGHIVTTQLDAEDTLRMVGTAFGFRVQGSSKSELLSGLEAFLLTQANQGRRCLLVVDEAQNLTARAIEELRMLSNFQLGNQSLLQSFLIGQPEFRQIMQSPEMEQFRQRVAATCHIGPLEPSETDTYIIHRLKCAGSTGEPEFEREAFEAIHAASRGIPRRINSICDRILLLGYMEGRKHFTIADVNEVMREFAEEGRLPARPAVAQRSDGNGAPAGNAITHEARTVSRRHSLDIELPAVRLESDAGSGLQRQLGELDAQNREERMQWLEQSLMRLERINQQTLATLQELVNALTKPRKGGDG